jgi:hypothetical protein
MGATVVNSLTASYWAGHKPASYKSQDLDKALKAYESVAGKTLTMITKLPTVPKATLGGIDTCIKDLQAAITELQKTQAAIKQLTGALQAVQGAAGKTSGELTKLSKGKDVDETEYKNAAISASSIGSIAADAIGRYQ